MRHVREIRTLIDEGQRDEALSALENLLSLGPNNLEALKIKAMLLSQQGRFKEESKIWDKIAGLDAEDTDAIQYFHKRYIEERERYYFTDELPSGGRRFLAHPRSLIYASFVGLVGCTLFLLLSNYSREFAILATPLVSMSLFIALVLLPWVVIVLFYFGTLREVVVSHEGVQVATRTRKYLLRWEDISSVHLTHESEHYSSSLSLVFVPKNREQACLEIDIADRTSAIRAPTFFVSEIIAVFGEPIYSPREKLNLEQRPTISF